MYSCAQCAVHACTQENPQSLPQNCPMRQPDILHDAFCSYKKEENLAFYLTSAEIEALGYGVWPRVKETIAFCEAMGYQKVGLAFCSGLCKEAKILDGILRRHQLEVVSVICKVGGIDKENIGIKNEQKVHPGCFEPMCNPVAQAEFLNEQHTQFNIALGLCVGHDSLFYKYSQAMVTTLVAKDRALAHNPVGALYCADGYFKDKL